MENTCKNTSKPKSINEFVKSWYFWKPFLGILVGGVAGFLYYHFVGCSSGSCFITSHSYSTIIFGGLSGYLITSGSCTRC
jgi:LytS/YehU family sensor histidine kinase